MALRLIAMMFYEIILCLFLVQASAGVSHVETRDDHPLCAVQCGAITRTKFRRRCSLANPSCICSFIDSYTLCAVARCSGLDRAAAIKVPLSFFVPEGMLVSDDDFEPICLPSENIVDSTADKGEKKESKNTLKSSISSATTVFEGDGIVITLDQNDRLIAKVEDEEPIQLNSHSKPTIKKRKSGGSGGGGHSGAVIGVGSAAGLGAASHANGAGIRKNNSSSTKKLVGSWHAIFGMGFAFIISGLT